MCICISLHAQEAPHHLFHHGADTEAHVPKEIGNGVGMVARKEVEQDAREKGQKELDNISLSVHHAIYLLTCYCISSSRQYNYKCKRVRLVVHKKRGGTEREKDEQRRDSRCRVCYCS